MTLQKPVQWCTIRNTEAEKGQSKNILQIPKNILNRNISLKSLSKSLTDLKNPKKICGSANNFLTNLKRKTKIVCKSIKLFQIAIFVQIIIEESGKSKKTLQIQKKLIGSANNFLENSYVNTLKSKNRLQIPKNIFEIIRKFCHMLLARCFPPFPSYKNGDWKSLEHQERCSVINVEENLGTMKYSALGVEH